MPTYYTRREGDGAPDKFTLQFINGNIDMKGLRHIKATVASAGAALPAPGSTVQEFTPVERTAAITVVCAGTVQKIGDSIGILAQDTKAGDTGTFYISGRWRFLVDAAGTPVNGGDAYIIVAAMDVTHTASTNDYLGVFDGTAHNQPSSGSIR